MENWRSLAGKEEEERGAASTLVGPARRSLRRWARPAPYSPSPRRFVSDFLSKPSPPIRTLLDTPRISQPRVHENASASVLEGNEVSGNRTNELFQEKELVTVDDSELAEIEKYLKGRTFSRDEADHLVQVIRSRTPAFDKVSMPSITKSATPINSEAKQSGLLAHKAITWKPGDSVYSKANALGCTPIDIAKAYMRELSSSRAGSSYQTRTSRDADNSSEKNDSSAKHICWPSSSLPVSSSPQSSRGNTVQDATPSRTPYVDSPFSRSTFKIKSDRNSCDLFSTGRKRRLNILDEGKNQKAKLQDDTISKFADPVVDGENLMTAFAQKGAYPISRSHLTSQSSLGKGKDEVGFNGASSVWIHNRRSTETAQKILSHLERAIPSPSEKPPSSPSETPPSPPSEKPPLRRKINRELPSRSLLIKNRKQGSFQLIGSSNQKMPDVSKDDGVSKSDAMTTKQKSDMGGFAFTFPVPAVNTASSEPPPTPTMPSPHPLPVNVNESSAPTYSFGSSSSSRLVFSFSSSDSTILDEEPPTFKFGSEEKRLTFSFSEKDAVCC